MSTTTPTASRLARRTYSVATLAEALSLSPDTIRRAMRTGELPAFTPSGKETGKRMFHAHDVEAWIATWPAAR